MANLYVELDNELIETVKSLAKHHYGDSTDASVSRVVESALYMRLQWSDLVEGSANEVEEPLLSWEFADKHPTQQLPSEIRDFLFKKGE